MLLYDNENAAAVFFFGEQGIIREMLYAEFEAVLDGVVPLPDWAGHEARAAYVEIDPHLRLTAAVFFRVAFDKEGAVVPSWRLPLQDLAHHAAKGPDLGAGPIRLACASRCPIRYHAGELWNPDMRPASNHFGLLRKAAERNRLGLSFRSAAEDGASTAAMGDQVANLLEQKITQQLRRQYEQSFRDHVAQLLKEQRLRAATLSADKDQALEELKREYHQRLERLSKQLKVRERRVAEVEAHNRQLKETVEGQAAKIQELREYFERKLLKMQDDERPNIEALQRNHALELEAKVAAATLELRESLQIRDMELNYRDEQQGQLREEIARLRRENKDILANSGDELLHRLSHKGVTFVTYQPGAGQITIPLNDMAKFTANSQQFAADHSGVSLQHYQAWLTHYQAPVCQAGGGGCSVPVKRVAVPADFHPGESDLCARCRNSRLANSLKQAPGQ